MSTVIQSILISALTITYSQSNQNQKSMSCPTNEIGNTCTLNCATVNSCKGYTLNCRQGDPCVINCIATSACADGAIINANLATDVTITCNATDACKTNMHATCGTGDCLLECSNVNTACEGFGSINISQSTSFNCIGNYCPTSGIPVPFTASPTTSSPIPTTYAPTATELPSLAPTKFPSLSPIKNPTISPSHNPTLAPSQKPTNRVIPTYANTNNPKQHSVFNPAVQPTHNPTQYALIEAAETTAMLDNIEPESKSESESDTIVYIGVVGGSIFGIILIAFCVKIVLNRIAIQQLRNRKETDISDIISATIPKEESKPKDESAKDSSIATNITPTIQSNNTNDSVETNASWARTNSTNSAKNNNMCPQLQMVNPPQLNVHDVCGSIRMYGNGMYTNNQTNQVNNITSIPMSPTIGTTGEINDNHNDSNCETEYSEAEKETVERMDTVLSEILYERSTSVTVENVYIIEKYAD